MNDTAGSPHNVKDVFNNLYSKFAGLQMEANQNMAKKSGSIKKSPFKKAGDILRRMSSMSSSGENHSGSIDKSGDEIFNDADCVNIRHVNQDRYYQHQISDTYGKEEIDEKIIAQVTGAKELLKKPKRTRGAFAESEYGEMNIFEILQLFRERQHH